VTPSISSILDRLTDAQKTVLCRCAPDERLMGGFYGLAWTDPPLVDPVGLNHPVFGSHYQLNATGLAVQSALREASEGNRS
jgi:hypothetical protein